MSTRVDPLKLVTIVSWFKTDLGDLQPTYIEVIIHVDTKYHGHPSRVSFGQTMGGYLRVLTFHP